MKQQILWILLVILLVTTSIWGMGRAQDLKDIQTYPLFSESPYDDVYEIETWHGDTNVLLTTRTLPIVEGNYLKIENYWWREWDEEGNEEWLRYANDYYYTLLPLEHTFYQILHIPDENNTAHIVKFGYDE